jgi:hypothetical protein
MLEDLAKEKQKKKKESSAPHSGWQRAKDTAAALRTKMTQTFSQRRREEQRALKREREEERKQEEEREQGKEQRKEEEREESTESEADAQAAAVKPKTRKMPVEDQGMAFTSSRRTTDRVLSSIREGNAELLTKVNESLQAQGRREKRRLEMEEARLEAEERWEERRLEAEEKKTSLIRQWLEAQQQLSVTAHIGLRLRWWIEVEMVD